MAPYSRRGLTLHKEQTGQVIIPFDIPSQAVFRPAGVSGDTILILIDPLGPRVVLLTSTGKTKIVLKVSSFNGIINDRKHP